MKYICFGNDVADAVLANGVVGDVHVVVADVLRSRGIARNFSWGGFNVGQLWIITNFQQTQKCTIFLYSFLGIMANFI